MCVIENGNRVNLCFASRPDAGRFKSFVNIYMDESGSRNGHSAYWILFNEKIIEVSENSDCKIRLNEDLVWDMYFKILQVRTAGNVDLSVGEISMGQKNGGITFNFGNFPDRICPEVGDMFRSLQSLGGPPRLDGRVVGRNGNILQVIACWNEESDGKTGKIKKNAEVIEIEAFKVMKISDWLAANRNAV